MPTGDSTVSEPEPVDRASVPSDVQLDRRLVERISEGDADALGELYDRYAALALGVAMRVVRDRDVGEDVVHDAFVSAWRRIGQFDVERGSVRSWLLTIVRNSAIDRVRARRVTIDVVEADEQALLKTGPDPTPASALARLSADSLRMAMAELPAEQREAVELAYFGGHSYRRVAELQGVPVGTANGRLRLALARLQSLLRNADG